MRNKKLLVFFLIFSFIFGSFYFRKNNKLSLTIAQEPSTTQVKSEPIELLVDAIYTPCEDPSSLLCTLYPADVTDHPDPANKNHEFGLIADNLPTNTDIYIAGCINTNQGVRCTTGNPTLDNLLNSVPGGDQMNPDPTHQFKALQNPVKTNASDELKNIIVRSFTPQATTHFFNAYYLSQAAITTTPNPEVTGSDASSIQQGQIDEFEKLTPTPQPTKPAPSRTPRVPRRRVNQDPKGRFFDSQSLEPIPEGIVTLLNSLKKTFVYKDLENPQKVKTNGEFNFYVPNGIYYLDITQKPANHIWPIKLDRVHNNYSKAYYCDPEVKDQKNQLTSLYLEQYSIVELNKLVHCDVPFDPGSSTPYRSEVKTVSYSAAKTNDNLSTVYSGRVTHPLTAVSLQGEATKKTVATTTADKLGYWEITIKNIDYPVGIDGSVDRLVALYQKTDLTTSIQTNKPINGIIFEPILTYIEGYAYNENGMIIPLAKVGYRQLGTEKIVYVTAADDEGFFRIPTRYLPSFGYELVFLAPNSTKPIVLATSKFTEKNNAYLKKNNLSLLTKVNKDLLLASTQGQKINEPAKEEVKTVSPVAQQSLQNQTTNQIFLIVILIFVLLVIVIVAIIIVFLRKKNSQTNSPLS